MFKIILQKDGKETLLNLPCKFTVDFRKEDINYEEYILKFIPENSDKLQDILLTLKTPNEFECYIEKQLANDIKCFKHMKILQNYKQNVRLNSKNSVAFSIVIPYKNNEYLFAEIELFSAKEI